MFECKKHGVYEAEFPHPTSCGYCAELAEALEALMKASRFIRSIYKADVVDELTCEDMNDIERSVGRAIDNLTAK